MFYKLNIESKFYEFFKELSELNFSSYKSEKEIIFLKELEKKGIVKQTKDPYDSVSFGKTLTFVSDLINTLPYDGVNADNVFNEFTNSEFKYLENNLNFFNYHLNVGQKRIIYSSLLVNLLLNNFIDKKLNIKNKTEDNWFYLKLRSELNFTYSIYGLVFLNFNYDNLDINVDFLLDDSNIEYFKKDLDSSPVFYKKFVDILFANYNGKNKKPKEFFFAYNMGMK